MRICFVIGAMNYSGAEKVLSIVMGELAKKGNEVAVILLEQFRAFFGFGIQEGSKLPLRKQPSHN